MWKLFGGKKQKKEDTQPKKDPMETVQHLHERIIDIEKRTKVLENKNKGIVSEALGKKNAGDKRGSFLVVEITLQGLCWLLKKRRCMIRKSTNSEE